MSRAADIANEAYEDFSRATRQLNDPEFMEALEELICALECSHAAKKEELKAAEEE